MKKIVICFLFSLPFAGFTQNNPNKIEKNQNISPDYKKRVLENSEINLLTSYYSQDGKNAAVTGGIGTEELTDFATNINVSIPLNDDDVLSIDATISAYTSASSSNLNPFSGGTNTNRSGASRRGGGDDDDEGGKTGPVTGTPWAASSGASREDVWVNGVVGYSHTSDDRNNIYNADISFATEYDYSSFGAGIGYTRLFNQKNTTLSLNSNIYLDTWNPYYPTEIKTYNDHNGNLEGGFFKGVDILDSNGNVIDKNGSNVWSPFNTTLIENKERNSYSASLSFSQILTKNAQISIFSDLLYQKGWLANPMQRVYFSNRDNYYIGNAASIPIYTSPANKDVFQLADDIERLPHSRFKIPIGVRFNYYINEYVILRTYYRYYFDDWGINSNTFNVELPIKIGKNFTLYPSYRYYNQTAADYFAPYEQHVSTDKFYTSDYDLSKFNSNQYGLSIRYTDIFVKNHLFNVLGLKSMDLNYHYYKRNTGFKSQIISLGIKFVLDK